MNRDDKVDICIEVHGLDMMFGERVIQHHMSFEVKKREIFVIMGDSGSGKSTLLKHMIGLIEPSRGEVFYDGEPFWAAEPEQRTAISRRFGVLFQNGALWSAMTLAENVGLPLQQYTDLQPSEIQELIALKLALVGLRGFEDFYPSDLSGGMRKRAGLARAIALDPDFLFFDEPSAGLDPLSSQRLDRLILELRDSLSATVVVVTHELESIFAIADNAIFLDGERQRPAACGDPRLLREQSEDAKVRAFLRREEPQPV